MYLSIAKTGQISVLERPIMRVTPIQKGSVLETFKVNFHALWITLWGKNVMSLDDRWSLGLNVPGQVNSLILRNPKKASVEAAHRISLFEEGPESRSWKSFRCVSVMGSQIRLLSPWVCLIPFKIYCNLRNDCKLRLYSLIMCMHLMAAR